MSCCGTNPGFEEIDEVSRLVAAKLAAFLRTLRDSGFAVGLQEGRDAASLMAAGYAEKPGPVAVSLQASVLGAQSRLGQVRRAVRCVLAGKTRAIAVDDDWLGEGGQQSLAEEPAGHQIGTGRGRSRHRSGSL